MLGTGAMARQTHATDSRPTSLGRMGMIPGGWVDLVVATLFINVLALAMPLTLLQIYDRILPSKGLGTLSLLLLVVGCALVLEGILRVARSLVSGWMGARFDHMAGSSGVDRVLSSDIVDYKKLGVGMHMELFSSLNTLREFYAGQAILNLLDLPFAILFISVIAYLAGWLALVPVSLGIMFVLSAVLVGRGLRHSLHERSTADDRRFDFIVQVLGKVHTVKAMSMEEQMLRRYERLQEGCATWNRDVALGNARATGVGAFFSQLNMFMVVGFGATYVIDGMLTIGGLAACTMLSGRSMAPMQKAAGMWTRYQAIRLARDRALKLFEIRPEAPKGLPQLPLIEGPLELRDVTFNYGKGPDDEVLPDIIKNVTLRIEPGETVGISGGNISGKTTLLHIMMAILKPVSGSVLIGGHAFEDYDPVSIRSQIAYLPQEAVLFGGTLLENITMFRPEKEEDALDVARLLGLDDVVAHMPFGYDTKTGDTVTETLPRGVKQRIAIARALVDKPRLILFDEANTAMDAAGDAMLKALLEKLARRVTIVLVTSRPSFLKISDRIYDLREGTLTLREHGDGMTQFRAKRSRYSFIEAKRPE